VEIPQTPWLCRRCESMEAVQCELCPLRTGPFKRTTNGQWVHVLCALWTPQLSFGNEELLEPVSGLSRVPASHRNKRCSLCKETMGVCVVCSQKGCGVHFHIMCARASGLFVEARPGPGKGKLTLTSYCKFHSLHHLEHYPHLQRPPLLDSSAKISQLANTVPSATLDLIYSYWRVKRRTHPDPLIERLQVMSDEGYHPVHTALSANEYRHRFVKLRQNFEKARILVDLVRKREFLKREHVRRYNDMFEFELERVAKRAKR